MIEEWKTIDGYEDYYEVSNLGRVRGKDRFIGGKAGTTRLWKGRILKSYIPDDGKFGNYVQVGLAKGCKTKTKDVHRLMAIAFIPNPDNKPEVNHRDGNKLNNDLSNLEWLTYSEHKLYGIHVQGHITNRKLCTEDVLNIKRMLLEGVIQRKIAEMFGVTQTNISRIKQNQSWKEVQLDGIK